MKLQGTQKAVYPLRALVSNDTFNTLMLRKSGPIHKSCYSSRAHDQGVRLSLSTMDYKAPETYPKKTDPAKWLQ